MLNFLTILVYNGFLGNRRFKWDDRRKAICERKKLLIHYEDIDRETTPLGTLSLHRYQAETRESGYEIRIEDKFLMATHRAHSEVAMAPMAYDRLLRNVAEDTEDPGSAPGPPGHDPAIGGAPGRSRSDRS